MKISEATLREEMKSALKAKDAARVQVIRAVLAAIKNRAIELKVDELAENELTAVLKREAKQRSESLEFARNAGRADLVAEHEAAISVVESFLPRQMSEPELRTVLEDIAGDIGSREIGPLRKELAKRHAGSYDGKTASRIIAEMGRAVAR